MNSFERRELESLVRVRNFGAENSADIKNNQKCVQGFDQIARDIYALENTGISRVSAQGARSSATNSKTAAKTELAELVRVIARTAATIAVEEPNFADKFDLPRRTLSFQSLLELARAFAREAAPVAEKFIEYGMNKDFGEKLDRLIAAAESAANTQDANKRGSIAANADTAAILRRALQTKRMLNTIVRNLFVNNPAKLADWTTAYHVERPPQPKKPQPPLHA